MEKEKLIIKNFGPIKNVELDLGRFNILIGEQATGKSTVAKVLAVCRYFSFIVEETRTTNQNVFSGGLDLWGLLEYEKKDTVIEYYGNHYSLICRYDTDVERILYDDEGNEIGTEEIGFTLHLTPISKDFKHLLMELDKVAPKAYHKTGSMTLSLYRKVPTSFYLNDVKNVMDNPFYLPTQRGLQSIFDIGKNSIQNLSSALFIQLSKMDGIARLYKQETYIEPLDIYYVNRNGHGYIRKAKETEFYSLYNAASGYQSMIPIVLTIKYYTELKKKPKTLLIEEPELDVFPVAQNKLIQYISEKSKLHGSMVLITTHSPYTLTSLNNMMYAYQVGQIHPEKVSKEIDKKYWLNPDDVSAYMLKTDGSYEDIFDREEGLIKAEKIDNASTEINKVFDELLNIEFKENELNTN